MCWCAGMSVYKCCCCLHMGKILAMNNFDLTFVRNKLIIVIIYRLGKYRVTETIHICSRTTNKQTNRKKWAKSEYEQDRKQLTGRPVRMANMHCSTNTNSECMCSERVCGYVSSLPDAPFTQFIEGGGGITTLFRNPGMCI